MLFQGRLLTVATNFHRPLLTTDLARRALRVALRGTQRDRPFNVDAIVLLPDHWHCIWTLPAQDTDFSTRMRLVKARFTRAYLAGGGGETGRSRSRLRQGERGVWHRRFWEHTVRDEAASERICDYIHYNPVKHGRAKCPHAWPYSSFRRFVRERRYEASWQCVCDGRRPREVHLDDLEQIAGE